MSLKNYDFIVDESIGEVKAVSLTTGEVTEAYKCFVPAGSQILTPDRIEAYKKWREEELKKERRRSANKPLGDFFFVPAKEQFTDIAPETVTRLVYLITFIGYDNVLMRSIRTPMRRKYLAEILNVSKATVSRLWNEVSPRYISETDGGVLLANNDIFRKGKIKQIQYRKFYINGIRNLYEEAQRNNHRKIGYFFKLLPYINIEYNLLCYNPWETDIKRLELMSMVDFCKLIGYNIVHLNDLMYAYRNIWFTVNDGAERFCTITYNGIHNNNARIFINPRILYCGNNYEVVENLGGFCKA